MGDRPSEAQRAGSLGNAYMLPGLRDLDQAEKWYRHSLSLRPGGDRLGRARCLRGLGAVALERFDDARGAGDSEPVLLQHLNTALRDFQQVLDLTAIDDHEQRDLTENLLGEVYGRAGETGQALHYQQAIKHSEARGDTYRAGQTRISMALLLTGAGRVSDALLYARAALNNHQRAGPGTADRADVARQLIAVLEQRSL